MHRHSLKVSGPVTSPCCAFSSCDLLSFSRQLHPLACDLLQYSPSLATPLNFCPLPPLPPPNPALFIEHGSSKLSRERKTKKKKKKRLNMMKGSASIASMLVLLILFPTALRARHIGKPHSRHGHLHSPVSSRKDQTIVKPETYRDTRPMMHKRADPLQIAGSSLPDCSHACGSCTPCRLVVVSFVCSALEEAETCPIAYKCMCHNKSYPVP